MPRNPQNAEVFFETRIVFEKLRNFNILALTKLFFFYNPTMFLQKRASKTTELEIQAEELLKANVGYLQEILRSPTQNSLPIEKQLTLINSTVRLVQASRRMNDNFKKAILTFFTSVLSSSATSIIIFQIFQQ